MKSLLKQSSIFGSLGLLLLVSFVRPAYGQDGRIQLTQLDHLTTKASQTVVVTLDEKLIQLTARLFSGRDPDEAKVKDLINGLKGVYVKVFEFENEGEYSQADLESVRSQLRGPGWSKIVDISNKKQGSLEVYLMTDTSRLGGLTLLASDPKELTVVNIVGPIDLEKLSQLEGRFGIPELDIETPKTKPRN